jgi:2-(1,2-epoxy-1,2-dihydrophenyl)acetyl-CoA isomerase
MPATETAGAATVRIERDGAVATLVLDRPDAMNAQTRASRRELIAAIREVGRDRGVRAVVLTGEGRGFCAGQDLREEGALDDVATTVRETYAPIVTGLVEMDKPVIAAINGPAAGAGLSFALACDLRVMAAETVLMMAFSNIALVPDSGGSWFLARSLGYNRALELAITGRRVGGEEALRLGLVEHVVPGAELRQTVTELAATLAARPTQAIAWTKRLLREAMTATLEQTIESEAQLQAVATRAYDHQEGVRAFLEKRAPAFEGR